MDEVRIDSLTVEERSKRMALVRAKDTKPEIFVRQGLYSLGFRYRTNYKKLPGKPDIAFPGRKKVIFIHGCFWHLHGCGSYKLPRTNTTFWLKKLEYNNFRDIKVKKEIERLGWGVYTVWECQIRKKSSIIEELAGFLND